MEAIVGAITGCKKEKSVAYHAEAHLKGNPLPHVPLLSYNQ